MISSHRPAGNRSRIFHRPDPIPATAASSSPGMVASRPRRPGSLLVGYPQPATIASPAISGNGSMSLTASSLRSYDPASLALGELGQAAACRARRSGRRAGTLRDCFQPAFCMGGLLCASVPSSPPAMSPCPRTSPSRRSPVKWVGPDHRRGASDLPAPEDPARPDVEQAGALAVPSGFAGRSIGARLGARVGAWAQRCDCGKVWMGGPRAGRGFAGRVRRRREPSRQREVEPARADRCRRPGRQ